MKDEYKKKIDEWMANRTTEELDYALESAQKEYIARNKVNGTELNAEWPRLYTAQDITEKLEKLAPDLVDEKYTNPHIYRDVKVWHGELIKQIKK